MVAQGKNRPSLPVRHTKTQGRLHTIPGLLRGRIFDGQFEAQGKSYRFSFAPTTASLNDHRLVLSGRIAVTSPQQSPRFVDGVEARLVATQGGVGVSPARRQLLTGTLQTSQTATAEQKMEQEKGPETELQPGLHAFESPQFDELGRPMVDSTGPLSFVGALYFRLSPLDGRALGVPLDLSRVQLNGRLAPTDDLGRDLQVIFSDVVAALYGDRTDELAANEQVQNLNRLLKS
jgi:hypothetical protein